MERAAYRIIDANFNRAREAARVVEDFCRFALNSALLTERAKSLRHQLCAAVAQLDAGVLIASRDTASDVGAGRAVDNQLLRGDLADCFTAGCKRLTEALRALAEVVRTENRALAEMLEGLRFAAYALEKDIVVFSEPALKFRRVGLYVIISSDLPLEIILLTGKCAAAGADCIQLRTKEMTGDRLFAVAVEFVRMCREAGALSIVNDRADIAVAAGADGVHLGQNDVPVAAARKLQMTPLIVGKSTHLLKELRAACAELPTYVSLGPVFATETKPGAEPVGLEYVTAAAKELAGTGIASVGIGGITVDEVERVMRAGAGAVAVCSAVTKASDPAAVCRALKEKIVSLKKG